MSRIRRVGQLENAAQIETENWSTHTHTLMQMQMLASVFPANWARFNPVLCGIFYNFFFGGTNLLFVEPRVF